MDTTKTDKATEPETRPADASREEASEPASSQVTTEAPTVDPASDTEAGHGEVIEDDHDDHVGGPLDGAAAATKAATAHVVSGAASVVAAGLGLASLTGSWLGTTISAHTQLEGQIHAQSKPPAQQIAALYTSPWHTTAEVNSVFAVLAVLVAAFVLLRPRIAAAAGTVTAPWVKAVAWGALVLGVIGLLLAGVVMFDIFTAAPHVPAAPSGPSGGGPAG